MNFVSLKAQDKSVAKIRDPALVSADGDTSAATSKDTAYVTATSGDSTRPVAASGDDAHMTVSKDGVHTTATSGDSTRPTAVTGELSKDKCRADNERNSSRPFLEAADPVPVVGASPIPLVSPHNPTILSKRFRPEGMPSNTITLSSGSDIPSISHFLCESKRINDPGLETRPQLESSHAMFVDSVAKVIIFLFVFFLFFLN